MRSANLELEDLPSGLKAVYEYWFSLKDNRFAPSWREIDLFEIPADLIPTTIVVDIASPVKQSTFRFWGSRLTEIHGVDMTGNHPYLLKPAEIGEKLLSDHIEIVERKCPIAWHYSFLASGGYIHSHSLVRLPLSDNGKDVSHILIVIDFSPEALAMIRNKQRTFTDLVREEVD